MNVVDVKRDVKPFNPLRPKTWGVHKPTAPAKYVVELAVGEAGETAIGDKVTFC